MAVTRRLLLEQSTRRSIFYVRGFGIWNVEMDMSSMQALAETLFRKHFGVSPSKPIFFPLTCHLDMRWAPHTKQLHLFMSN